MAFEIVATAAFERDYDSALAYLTYQLASPQAAPGLMDAMDESASRLAENPRINPVSSKPSLERLGYREERVGGYIVLYRIEDDAVVFKRMFHASQDYERYV